MRRAALDLLCCPQCGADLTFAKVDGQPDVVSGTLVCTRCSRRYAIRAGIARFVSANDLYGTNRSVARFYDRFARFYALSSAITFALLGGERRARMEVLDRLELSGGRLLEVSIGPGVNLPHLFAMAQRLEVHGLDVSAGQLQCCASLVASRAWPVDLYHGLAEALPFRADTFDGVLHVGGINLFTGMKQAIDEMIRVARPGARIVIADETARLTRFFSRLLGTSPRRSAEARATPADLLPYSMERVQVRDIWKVHGKPHGYCLAFTKPG